MRTAALLLIAAFAPQVPSATAQHLLVVESTGDTVMMLDANDGSVITPVFIDLNTATPAPSTPIEAVIVGDEIWISDQVADVIFRYSSDGTTFLGAGGVGRDNMRGIATAGNASIYVTNSGTGGSGHGDACKEYFSDGSLNNVFAVGDPFDALDHCGTLLIANIADESIDRFAYDGTPLGIFHDSDGTTGIDFPEQISARKNGNVLAGGFSTPSGIYEYDWEGNQLNYYDTGTGTRGVAELGNGLLLYTHGGGVSTYDPDTGDIVDIVPGVSGRFVTLVDGSLGTNYCTSTANSTGSEALIAAAGSTSIMPGDVTLSSQPVPNQSSIFFVGDAADQVPFGNGFRCASTGIIRLDLVQGSGNVATGTLDPNLIGVVAGQTSFVQHWFRDPFGGGAFFNTSNGLCITWLP